MKELKVFQPPSLFSFCGESNIAHCEEDFLMINNKTDLRQYECIDLEAAK